MATRINKKHTPKQTRSVRTVHSNSSLALPQWWASQFKPLTVHIQTVRSCTWDDQGHAAHSIFGKISHISTVAGKSEYMCLDILRMLLLHKTTTDEMLGLPVIRPAMKRTHYVAMLITKTRLLGSCLARPAPKQAIRVTHHNAWHHHHATVYELTFWSYICDVRSKTWRERWSVRCEV